MPKFEANNLNGVMPAMITSFNKDESINKDGLRNIINHSINEKVNGLLDYTRAVRGHGGVICT